MAIKVLLAERADARFLHAFQNEIAQVARLDHPGIVMVLDHGQIPDDAAQASQGKLIGGSPWFAMEFASGGTLAQAGAQTTWPAVVDVIRQVLAGLAHAHARGVLHRDIKPANILMGSARDLRPGPAPGGQAHRLQPRPRVGRGRRDVDHGPRRHPCVHGAGADRR